MGTGRSGIPKGVKNTTKSLSGFKVTAKNLKDYNMSMESRLKKNVSDEQLNLALETFNRMGEILGIDPNNLPAVSLGFTTKSSVYGDCRMVADWEKFNADARIRLTASMFNEKNYDTMAHEYVHALEAWMIKTNLNRPMDQINAWIDSIYSEAICVRALQNMGKQKSSDFDKSIWKTHADTIKLSKWDNYASSKPAETVTRAMQSVLRFGDGAPEYAKAVVAELRKEVLRTQKKRKKK